MMILKEGKIRKIKDKWVVLSRKNKPLGSYDSKSKAEERLKQVEMFKHMNLNNKKRKNRKKKVASFISNSKKSNDDLKDNISYSSVMRQLRQEEPEKLVLFMKSFKHAFDDAFLNDHEEPAEPALLYALKSLRDDEENAELVNASQFNRLIKLGNEFTQLGDPTSAGVSLSEIIKFILRRINEDKRHKALVGVKTKLLALDPVEISGKKAPQTASMGQAITLVKTILIGHHPYYIKRVIQEITKRL